jgi:hypothetical protein
MANGLFASYRTGVLNASVPNVDTATIKAMFLDNADDTAVLASDNFLDDILSAARVPALGSCPTLANTTTGTVGAGIFDADNTTFTALSGDPSEQLIIFEDSGSEATSDLLAMWDTATGLPLTPNGGDVVVTWAAGGIYTF